MRGFISSNKASRDCGHKSSGIKRKDSSVWLSQTGEFWDTWDSLEEISFNAVTPPGTRTWWLIWVDRRREGHANWKGTAFFQTQTGDYIPN
jgi:hypothetical protein